MTKTDTPPLISVIVPVYKVEPWLDRCVASIVGQSWQALEIWLVDDGSPDACGALCDAWATRDERVRVIHKANGGLADARNCGIEAAGGAWLCFVDSDDWLEPEMIERLYAAARDADAPIAVCGYLDEDQQGAPAGPGGGVDAPQVLTGRALIDLAAQPGMYNFCEVAWNKLYRRDVFARLRYPTGKIHEDAFVFHHIFENCPRVACIPYAGYHYCHRADSIMGRGGDPRCQLEAFLDRCACALAHDHPALAARSEPELWLRLRHGALKGLSHAQACRLRDACMDMARQMCRRGWMPCRMLCWRWSCYYILLPMAPALRRIKRLLRRIRAGRT